jgi:hypothetical protein
MKTSPSPTPDKSRLLRWAAFLLGFLTGAVLWGLLLVTSR